MKQIIDEFLTLIIHFISLIVLCLGFYLLFTSLVHMNYLSSSIVFQENNDIYKDYMDNLNKIKNNIDSYSFDSSKYVDNMETMNHYKDNIYTCHSILSNNNTIAKLKNGDVITDYDIYEINNYFIETVVNDCWIKNLANYLYKEENYQGKYKYDMVTYRSYINTLVNNANYLTKELRSNYNVHYVNENSEITSRNEFSEHLSMMMRIYDDFSKIIYDMSNYLVDGEKLVMHNE